jgi:hypothetical protein
MPPFTSQFHSSHDPIPGLDAGEHQARTLGSKLQLGGLQLTLKGSTQITVAPRKTHGVFELSGNRLVNDLDLTIGGADWSFALGCVLSQAPFSAIGRLDRNHYWRLGASFQRHTFYVSNDAWLGTDHGLTMVVGYENRLPQSIGNLQLHAVRVRGGGTTGVPNKRGPIITQGGRGYYGAVFRSDANAGFITTDVVGTFRGVPFRLSVTAIDDRIRVSGQNFIHDYVTHSPRFSPDKQERAIFFELGASF